MNLKSNTSTHSLWKKQSFIASFLALALLCGMADTTVFANGTPPSAAIGQIQQMSVKKETPFQDADTEEDVKPTTNDETSAKSTKKESNSDKMNAWKKKNSDVMGYLNIPGTNIDYPIVKTTNNTYYSNKGYDKKYSYNGVIWADQDVTSKSSNTVLYGHNWTNYSSNPRIGNAADVMFGQLTAYHHLDFAKEHPTLEYADASGDATWIVFGAFYTTDLAFYINCSAKPTYLASKIKKMNVHPFDVDVKDTDKVLTLSTCTRNLGKFENQRFVVMARKLRKGEKVGTPIK